MKSARGRVTIMIFPCVMPNTVYTLNASGSVAGRQLLEYIMSLYLPQKSIPPSSRSIGQVVTAAIRKLKAMPSDPTRYRQAERSVHL
ncbi:hypothetical protein HOY80DRAFT_1140836, partial [Tuber brumale]